MNDLVQDFQFCKEPYILEIDLPGDKATWHRTYASIFEETAERLGGEHQIRYGPGKIIAAFRHQAAAEVVFREAGMRWETWYAEYEARVLERYERLKVTGSETARQSPNPKIA